MPICLLTVIRLFCTACSLTQGYNPKAMLLFCFFYYFFCIAKRQASVRNMASVDETGKCSQSSVVLQAMHVTLLFSIAINLTHE